MITSSSTHSNAFNFLGFMQGQVDPRTGQYTLGIELPKLAGNDLIGPALPLRLDFSPLNPEDSGYGTGWSLNLTQYDPSTGSLSLITGESYHVTSDLPKPALIAEQKLVSFEFYKDDADNYRVVHRSGLIEHLRVHVSNGQRVALPYRVYAASGHWIELAYARPAGISHECLSSIADATGRRLLWVEYQNLNQYRLHLHPDDGIDGASLSTYTIKLGDRKVTDVVLPEGEANWHFEYLTDASTQNMTCLKHVRTPTGSRETITYDDAGHLLPAGHPLQRLPRVASHEVDPGFEQPKMLTRYTYSATNFMGGNSALLWTPGEDTLYKVPGSASYFYECTQTQQLGGKDVRKVFSRYNRYHLLMLQRTEQYGPVAQLDAGQAGEPVEDWHIQETETLYHEDLTLGFALQPRKFQMAKFAIERWRMQGDTNKLRQQVTHTDFDEHGNQVLEIQPNGVRTVSEYYLAEGEDGCPADPQGFVRSLKRRTIHPAQAAAGTPPEGMPETIPALGNIEEGASVLSTAFRYRLFDALNDATRPARITDQYLVVESERLEQGVGDSALALQQTERSYLNQPDKPALHGRQDAEQQTLYDPQAKGLLAGETIQTQWRYPNATSRKAAAPLEVRETVTCKGQQKNLLSLHSSLTGDVLREQDLHGNFTAYEYDALQRVVKKTLADGTPNAAVHTFAYELVASDGQQATVTVTDAKGVVTRSCYDGAYRLIEQWRKTESATAEQKVYTASYDALGQMIEDTSFDHAAQFTGGQLQMTTRYVHGAWEETSQTWQPDGTCLHNAYSPFGEFGDANASWLTSPSQPTVRQQHTQTHADFNDKTVRVLRFDADGVQTGRQDYYQDGLGQCRREEQRLRHPVTGREELRTTLYAYDACGRMLETVRPDKSVLRRRFAAHSRNELVEQLFVHKTAAEETGTSVCEREFDGLERMTRLAGPRQEAYEYPGEQMLMSKRTTAGMREFEYTYDTSLSSEPTSITAKGQPKSEYQYDSLTTAILSADSETGTRSYAYTDQGLLCNETWDDKAGGQGYSCDHATSLQGRPLSRDDSDQQHTRHGYDAHGRLSWTTQNSLRADFTYDDDGRLWKTETRDTSSKHGIVCEQLYDSLGREHTRHLTRFDDQTQVSQQTITQVWRDDDLLHSRSLERGGQPELTETFSYDLRNRLEGYRCEGELHALPCNAKGRAIEEQAYSFDDLDNLVECQTWFADGSKDTATYTCAGLRLTQVQHTHDDYLLKTVAFSYDDDGNMLNDEAGNQLVYDDHGRLQQVRDGNGQALYSYRYDGHDHLVGVRQGTAPQEVLRRYQNQRLHSTVEGNVLTQYLYDGERPLGLQQQGDAGATRLLLTNMSNSVLGESSQGSLTEARYSAYGGRDQSGQAPELQGLLAFNGEARERALGWYLLGRGYRAYNPELMRFHSPDSMPQETAGINPYMYCLGDPVNWRDPSGHVRAPSTPPATGGSRRKRSSNTWQWIALAGAALFAAITIVPFAPAAFSALTTIGFAAMSATAKIALTVGIAGSVVQVGALGLQAAAMAEDDPEKAQTMLTTAGVLSGIGAMATGGATFALRSAVAAAQAAKGAAQAAWSAKVQTAFQGLNRTAGATTGVGRAATAGPAASSSQVSAVAAKAVRNKGMQASVPQTDANIQTDATSKKAIQRARKALIGQSANPNSQAQPGVAASEGSPLNSPASPPAPAVSSSAQGNKWVTSITGGLIESRGAISNPTDAEVFRRA